MSVNLVKVAAYSVIRGMNTESGREAMKEARQSTRTEFGALCIMARKFTPYDEIEACSEIAAEASAILSV